MCSYKTSIVSQFLPTKPIEIGLFANKMNFKIVKYRPILNDNCKNIINYRSSKKNMKIIKRRPNKVID